MKVATVFAGICNIGIVGICAFQFYNYKVQEQKKLEQQEYINTFIEEIIANTENTVKIKFEDSIQISCLAKNIYFEARSESDLGKEAVAWTTLNRVNHGNYPSTVCGVVYQAKLDQSNNPIKHKCSFSWYCDGKDDLIEDQNSWNNSIKLAYKVYYGNINDPTDGSIMYHAEEVKPYWKDAYTKTVRIDNHIFYKEG